MAIPIAYSTSRLSFLRYLMNRMCRFNNIDFSFFILLFPQRLSFLFIHSNIFMYSKYIIVENGTISWGVFSFYFAAIILGNLKFFNVTSSFIFFWGFDIIDLLQNDYAPIFLFFLILPLTDYLFSQTFLLLHKLFIIFYK